MAIEKLLNPQEEKANNNMEIVVDEIVKGYAYSIGDKTHETNEEDMIIPKVGYFEIIEALHKFYFYKKQNHNGNSE